MNKSIALGAVFAVAISMGVTPAFAQYMGSGGAGNQDGGHPSMSLEDTLELAAAKVQYAADNPGSGSGTPYLAADGVIGASAIAALQLQLPYSVVSQEHSSSEAEAVNTLLKVEDKTSLFSILFVIPSVADPSFLDSRENVYIDLIGSFL